MMDKAQQPYVMTLPAFEGNLRERFDLSRDDWRDPIIFVEKADNIRFVSINYPTERTKSFQLSREGEATGRYLTSKLHCAWARAHD